MAPLHLDLNQSISGLPSWVPDWTYCNSDPSDYAVARYFAASSYRCSKDLDGTIEILKFERLELSGIEIDSISRLSSAWRIMRSPIEQLALIGDWHSLLGLETHGDEAYIQGGTIKQASLRSMFADRFHEYNNCRPREDTDIEDWEEHLKETSRKLREKGPRATIELHRTMSSHAIACLRRRLFVTPKGYIGLCPESCQIGDKVFALCLCPAPIFLRPADIYREDGVSKYTALGHGYVHGLMDGEAVEMDLPPKHVSII